MEEISNRCKEIEQRVKALIDRKKDQKEQRNPNLPSINLKQQQQQPHYNKYIYQRPASRERELSRNKSIELARQESSLSQRQQASKKSIERPSSRDRLASLERNHSKDSGRRAGVIRYKY